MPFICFSEFQAFLARAKSLGGNVPKNPMFLCGISGKERKLQVVGLHTVKHLFWQQTVPQPTTLPNTGPNDPDCWTCRLDVPGRSRKKHWTMCKCKSHRGTQVSLSSLFWLETEWERQTHITLQGEAQQSIAFLALLEGCNHTRQNPVASTKCFLACQFLILNGPHHSKF